MRVLIILLVVLSITSLYAQDILEKNKPAEVKLIVDSDPPDAEVYIDGQLYGRTPLAVKELSPGKYEVKIKKESFNVFTEKTEIPSLGFKEVFGVLSGKYALLNLESSVPGAEVFMGDSFLGTAPLQNVHIPLGRHTLKARSKDYFDWNMEINASATQYNFKAVMKYQYGYITLDKSPGETEVFIDGRKVDARELDNFKLRMGDHKIKVNRSSFNIPVEEDFLVSSETRSSVKIESGYFSLNSFFRSLILPGLGQHMDNAKIKGIAIFSGTLLSGMLWLTSELSNSKKLKEYNDAREEYSKTMSTSKVFDAHNRLSSTYDAVKKSNTMKNVTMGTFIAVYAYNVLDALIFHSRGQRLVITQEKPQENSFNIGLSMAL